MMIKKVNSSYNEKGRKEDNDQHEDRDQKGCEQLQAQEMQDEDHQDRDDITKRIANNCSQEGGSLKHLSFKRFNSKAIPTTS
jgi:hypothetical protein